MPDHDLTWLAGWQLRELMLRREVSPREVVRHFLDRIDRLDPRLHCFVTVAAEDAMRFAGELERDHLSLHARPLYGVPVSVKDQYPTRGIRTTAGSKLYADHVPARDAVVVQRLKDAGAVIVGKTTTPEFALSWHTRSYVSAATVNPWDIRRTAGGSSGGAAASVSAGLTPVAIGSDCAGSIRLPAAFCGVIGLLAGPGRVPAHDTIGGSPYFSRIGPIARDPRDAARVLCAIAGPHADDPTRGISTPDLTPELAVSRLRCGWWTAARTATTDDRVVAAARAAADLVGQLGALVCEIPHALRDEAAIEAFDCINSSDHFALLGRDILADQAKRAMLTPLTADWFERAGRYEPKDYVLAMEYRRRIMAEMDSLLGHYDLLLSPTVAFTAPVEPTDWFSRPAGITAHTFLANFCGFPAVTVPCGSVDGLPVGLQLVGRMRSEGILLAACAAFQAALPPMAHPEPRVA